MTREEYEAKISLHSQLCLREIDRRLMRREVMDYGKILFEIQNSMAILAREISPEYREQYQELLASQMPQPS